MKKINIFAKMFLVVAFALVANSAFSANASFNDNASPHDPGASDLPTIMVRNKTAQGNCTTNCAWYTSVSANPGDIVTVQIYYHNTSESTSAVGTLVKLNTPSGASTNFNISGSVSASNASSANGSASVTISGGQSQTLDFVPGTVFWYAEKPLVNKGLLGAENNLFTSQGLFLGTVLPWDTCTVPGPYYQDAYCHRGFVTAQFKVSTNIVPPPPPPYDVCNNLPGNQAYIPNGYYSSGGNCYPTQQNNNTCVINSYYADDTSVDYNDNTTLHWNTTNCSSVSIVGIGNVSLDGSVSTGMLKYDRTFVINAYASNSWTIEDTDSVTIYVDEENTDNCTIDDFYAEDDDIENGDSTELVWETTDCDYVTISGIGSHMDPNDSEDTPDLYSDKTYTIYAYGDDSDDSDSLSIDVDGYTQIIYACNDGKDNDNDGKVDLYDLGCSSVFDNDEYNYIPPVVVPPVVHTQYIYTNTGGAVAGNTLIELTIDSRNENVNAGDLIDYTVTYKNKSNKETFEDVIINVDFPMNVEFIKSQQGTFSEKDNELTIQLGTLAPNETGTIYMTGKVKNTAINNEVLVTRATMADRKSVV